VPIRDVRLEQVGRLTCPVRCSAGTAGNDVAPPTIGVVGRGSATAPARVLARAANDRPACRYSSPEPEVQHARAERSPRKGARAGAAGRDVAARRLRAADLARTSSQAKAPPLDFWPARRYGSRR